MRIIGSPANLLRPFITTALRALSTAVAVMATACGGGDTSSPVPPSQATSVRCVSGTETLTIVSGNAQTAAPGSLLPEPATVRFTCESFANRGTTIPVAGKTVEWSGSGLVDGTLVTTKRTDSSGLTSVAWTLPPAFLSHSLGAFHGTSQGGMVSVVLTAFSTTSTTTATTCQDVGGTDHGALTVAAADLAWTAAGSPHRGGTIRLDSDARLRIEAGAVICLAEIAGRVTAEGTAQVPVRFFGTSMPVSPELRYVLAENAMKVGSVTSPAAFITDSTFRWTAARDPLACAQVAVSTGSSWEVQRILISGYGSQECAALHVSAYEDSYYGYPLRVEARVVDSVGDGVFIAGSVGGVSFINCEVSSSRRHGIVVPVAASAPASSASVWATGCNLFGNGGDAINNQSSITVNAGGNWWGDPAGPLGAHGDGTSGIVDASSPSPAPLSLGW